MYASESGLPPPRDYFESFTQLAGIQVLPGDFSREVAACTGLRNRLVHEYDEIDHERVYEGLQAAMRDVPEYLRRVQRYVNEHTETT